MHNEDKRIVCILIGGVGGLCVLLISVSINIVAIIYQLSVRWTQSAGRRENEEQL